MGVSEMSGVVFSIPEEVFEVNKGDLVILSGGSASGKTAVAFKIAANSLNARKKVVLVSDELSVDIVMYNLYKELGVFEESDIKKVEKLIETGSFRFMRTLDGLVDIVNKLKDKEGNLVVIIDTSGNKTLDQIVGLKELADSTGVSVVLTHQTVKNGVDLLDEVKDIILNGLRCYKATRFGNCVELEKV